MKIFLFLFFLFTGCTHVVDSRKVASETAASSVDAIIQNLTSGSEIPEEIFSKFSINEIAEAIVNRIRAEEIDNSAMFEDTKFKNLDMEKDSDILLFFWENNISSVEDLGFLNLHQTKASHGINNSVTRIEAEDIDTSLALGDSIKSLELRPKSALLNIRVRESFGNRQHGILNHFGDIAAVMKKDIRKRSVWFNTDSFFLAGNGFGAPSLKELQLHRGTFYRDRIPGGQIEGISYFKVFIYGAVGFDDVESFLVFDKAKAEPLKKYGKNIYRGIKEFFEATDTNPIGYKGGVYRDIFTKGELLFAGEK